MSHSNPLIVNDNNKIATSNIEASTEGAERPFQSDQPSLASAFLALGAPVDERSRRYRTMIASQIAEGADANAHCSQSLLAEETLLGAAISARDTEVVELLLHHGADPSLNCTEGVTPFTLALRERNGPIIQLLLKYCNRPKEGLGPISASLFRSVLTFYPGTARQLIEKNAVELLGNGTVGDNEPLMIIMRNGDMGSIRCALQKLQLSDPALKPYIAAGLRAAREANDLFLGRYMVQCGAELSWDGSSSILFSMNVLNKFPDDPINQKDKYGNTVLHHLVQSGPSIGYGATWEASVALAIERGADPTIRNLAGKTPFACEFKSAADNGRFQFLKTIKSILGGEDLKKYEYYKIFISQRLEDRSKIRALAQASVFRGVKVNHKVQVEITETDDEVSDEESEISIFDRDKYVEAMKQGTSVYILVYHTQRKRWVLLSCKSLSNFFGNKYDIRDRKHFRIINQSKIPGLEALIDGETSEYLSPVARKEILKKMEHYTNQRTVVHTFADLPLGVDELVIKHGFMKPVRDRTTGEYGAPSRSGAVEYYKKLRDIANKRAATEQPKDAAREDAHCVV